jgi:hypothetical protein
MKISFKSWLRIVQSPDIPEYISQLHEFSAAYSGTLEGVTSATQGYVQYIKKTWLKEGRREALVQAWTNQCTHFGATVTSRLVLLYYPYNCIYSCICSCICII